MLTLNVDVSHTAFLEQDSVPKYLAKALQLPSESALAGLLQDGRMFRKAEKAISGLKVPTFFNAPYRLLYACLVKLP